MLEQVFVKTQNQKLDCPYANHTQALSTSLTEYDLRGLQAVNPFPAIRTSYDVRGNVHSGHHTTSCLNSDLFSVHSHVEQMFRMNVSG